MSHFNRNQLGEIYVDITDMPFEDMVIVKFARYIRGVKYCANFVKGPKGVTVIDWEEIEEGRVIPDHCKLQLARDTARFLIEGIKKIMDHENRPNAQLTEAMQQHIDDLRAITFRQLEIEEPRETISILKIPPVRTD